MAQNVYDDPEFFRAYSALPRSVHGLEGAPEWSTIRSMVPPMQDQRVIDLGCGFGWFCRWAVTRGAASVVGLDLSENMLRRAGEDTDDERISYEQRDLDVDDLPEGPFGVAYSSLALHYVADLRTLLARVRDVLVPGGALVFSVEHPIVTAPMDPGFVGADFGSPSWPVDHYLDEGPRTTDWLAPGVVKQHRTIESYLSLLRDTGFRLGDLREWAPSVEQVEEHFEWAVERHRPNFLLVAATRGSTDG